MGQVLSDIFNNENNSKERSRQDVEVVRHVAYADSLEEARRRRVSHTTIYSRKDFFDQTKTATTTENELQSGRVLNSMVKEEEKLPRERWIEHYSSSHKILLVGEGDFSFSACLAKAFGSAQHIVATSLDSFGFLMKNYKGFPNNKYELESRGATVMHDVDATEMANHYMLFNLKFDRIVFNFPLAGFFPEESRQSQISRNQKLVSGFLQNAKKMINKDGEIHITHKSMGFFLQWNLHLLAAQCGLRLKEEVPFDLDDYPGYQNKYGYGGDKNFDCNPSSTYKFAFTYC